MSGLRDLYVEKLTARMNLDEVQRAKVEKELRNHLEEAVRKRVLAGLSPEAAEKEAIGAFGQPSLIARQFGIVSGTGWLIFERCALAAIWMLPILLNVFPFFKRTTPTEHFDPLAAFCIGLTVLVLIIASSLWPVIEVNGMLRIRRFFKRTLGIPFDKVQRVSFQNGHLFGKRRIEVAYEGGRVVLGPDNRNFRCAAVALNVLAPDAFDEEVRDYIASQTSPEPRSESRRFAILMSLYWLFTAVVFAFSWPELWDLRRVPDSYIAAWILVIVGVVVQARLHKNRAKKGVCWLLLVWLVLLGVFFFFSFIYCELWMVRWMLTAELFWFSIPLLILWWPGNRLQLVAVCAVLLIAPWSMGWLVTPTWNGPIEACDLEGRFPDNFQYVGSEGNQIVYLDGTLVKDPGSESPELVFLSSDEPPVHKHLDPELDWLFPYSVLEEYIALQGIRIKDKEVLSTQIVVFDKAGQVVNEGVLPRSLNVKGYLKGGRSVCVSPGADYVLVGNKKRKGEPWDPSIVGVYDLVSDTTKALDVFTNLIPVQWLDNQRLTAVEFIHAATNATTKPEFSGVRVWTVDTETGSGTTERELPLPELSYPHALEGGKYLCLYKGAYDPFQGSTHVGVALFDLETGQETHLPDRCDGRSFREDYIWSASSMRLVYLTGTQGELQIVVANPGGVVATLPLESSVEISEIGISPDGSKLFFIECPAQSDLRSSFFHHRVWDIDRNLTGTLRANGFMADGLEGLFGQLPAAWSPDSCCLAFPAKKALWFVDIEAWAEGQVLSSEADGTD